MNDRLLSRLEDKLGIEVENRPLFRQAFIHRSFVNEAEGDHSLKDNETLEFVGDAVLSFIVTDWLYLKYPDYNEGELTNLRAALVRRETLARFARQLDLGAVLRLGRGEDENGGRERASLLCDVFEAVLGAIYLDRGLDTARKFVLEMVSEELDRIVADSSHARDAKSRLQEWSQGELGETPRYRIVKSSGPDHAREYVTQVWLEQQPIGVGQGRSKRESSLAAAMMALVRLGHDVPEYREDAELEGAFPLPELAIGESVDSDPAAL